MNSETNWVYTASRDNIHRMGKVMAAIQNHHPEIRDTLQYEGTMASGTYEKLDDIIELDSPSSVHEKYKCIPVTIEDLENYYIKRELPFSKLKEEPEYDIY